MGASLYETLSELCEKKGVTPYRMCKDIGIPSSLMTDLKAGRRKGITTTTADKIATYFSVSLEVLLGKETEKDDELQVYLEELKNREEMRMLFSLAKDASKEDVEKAVKIIEALSGK